MIASIISSANFVQHLLMLLLLMMMMIIIMLLSMTIVFIIIFDVITSRACSQCLTKMFYS